MSPVYKFPESGTHGDGYDHIAALLFKRIDDSSDGMVKKFGDFLPKGTAISHYICQRRTEILP